VLLTERFHAPGRRQRSGPPATARAAATDEGNSTAIASHGHGIGTAEAWLFSMSDALPKMITPTPADHAAIRYVNGRNAAAPAGSG